MQRDVFSKTRPGSNPSVVFEESRGAGCDVVHFGAVLELPLSRPLWRASNSVAPNCRSSPMEASDSPRATQCLLTVLREAGR